MSLPFTREQMLQVYGTNLIQYAKLQGFEMKKSDRKSYHIKGYGGLYVFEKGYHHFSNSVSGNIIDFAKEFQNLTFIQAVENILGTEAYQNEKPLFKTEKRGEIILPKRSDNNNKVTDYLTKSRCLEPIIVEDLIKQGKIYQATTEVKGMVFENCAFVSFNEQKQPKYCALRGLGSSSFRQDIKNSDKTYGFLIKGTSDRVFVFESPIDAISHASISSLNDMDYKADNRISEGCLSDKALVRFLRDNEDITEIVFCFDNDIDGIDHNKQPHNHGQLFAKKCVDKFSKLGFKTYIQTPSRKDFNADLQYIKKSVIKELRSRQSSVSQNDKGDRKYERWYYWA